MAFVTVIRTVIELVEFSALCGPTKRVVEAAAATPTVTNHAIPSVCASAASSCHCMVRAASMILCTLYTHHLFLVAVV